MLVNASAITGLFLNLKTTFNKAFDAAMPVWSKIAMEVPSTGKSNEYTWIDRFPKMREWVGEKVVKRLGAHVFTIVNKDFEATVAVNRNDIEDDQIGIYGPMAQEAGYSSAMWPDELILGLVNGSFTETGFDGQYFCDTDHPVGSGVQSNKGTAPLKFDTLANAQASLGAAITSIRSRTDDEGRPLNLMPNLLLVPPALEETANTLMAADRLEDGKPNPYKGKFEVVSDARLTSATAWWLLVTNRPIKPFLLQMRKRPVFVQQTDMDTPNVFMNKEFLYGAEARGNAGFCLWHMIYGSTGTG